MLSGLRYVTSRACANSRACLVYAVCASACAGQSTGEVPRQPVLLIDHAHWQRYAAAEDPLPNEQPAAINCGAAGYYVEQGRLELDSSFCNYALIEHPALVDVDAGAEIAFELSHFDLTASEPARAHVALFFDETLAWETWLDIPSAADVTQVTFRAPRALGHAAPIRLHFHNHGQNNYALGQVFAKLPIARDD
jgi:hypothetical protein